MRHSNRWWKRRVIKEVKKEIKKFKSPDGQIFGDWTKCGFCKIYFTYWGGQYCGGCLFNIEDGITNKWECLKFKCYVRFLRSIRIYDFYPGVIPKLTFKQRELAKKCEEVLGEISIILKKLPSHRFHPTLGSGFPELSELRER